MLYQRMVTSLKDSVAFVTSVNISLTCIMAVYPLLFLAQSRKPYLYELSERMKLIGFIEKGFQNHRSATQILHLQNQSLLMN